MKFLNYPLDGKNIIQVFGVNDPDSEMGDITFGGC